MIGKSNNMKVPRTMAPKFLFRDCQLTESSLNVLREALEEKSIIFAEIKRENWIDRKTGKAGHGGLENSGKVPAGTLW